MERLLHFIRYNNAVSIAVAFFLVGSGAFAASPDAREAATDSLVKKKEEVRSIDNTYLLNKDLSSYTPEAKIVSVQENDTHYFVTYTLNTIDIVDRVWKDVAKKKQIKVSKEALGERDLGLYVSEQIRQVVHHELTRLKETKKFEKREGPKKRIASTEYSGLIGRFMDSKTEELPGYTPVKKPQPDEPNTVAKDQTASAGNATNGSSSSNNSNSNTTSGQENSTELTATYVVSEGDDRQPPVLQILGNNPARIDVDSTYSDLGALVTDNKNQNIGYKTHVNGEYTRSVSLDTSTSSIHRVAYSAQDEAGNRATTTRIVLVGDAQWNGETPPKTSPEVNTSSTDTSTSDDSTSSSSGSSSDEQQTNETNDTTAPEITLNGSNPVEVTKGEEYLDAGASATDDRDGDLTDSIAVDNPVDTSTTGEYTVTYTVSDGAGNQATATRTVNVVEDTSGETASSTDSTSSTTTQDTIAPEITLNGSNPIEVEKNTTYTDPGASATDDVDGNITDSINVDNPVDTSTTTQYTVTYTVSDSAGNQATKARTVNVVPPPDTTPPEITLNGSNPVEVTKGEEYLDAGASATDDRDGDLTDSIAVDNPVDTSTTGEYTVTYTVSDGAGNQATATRTVNVVEDTSGETASSTDSTSTSTSSE